MRTETYTEADARAEKLMDSILIRKHTEGEVARAMRVGNVWRALSNGVGWDPEPKNPIDTRGRPLPLRLCSECAYPMAPNGESAWECLNPNCVVYQETDQEETA